MKEQVQSSEERHLRFPSLNRLILARKQRQVPVVRQLSISDCGAAALAMVLGYFGRKVPLDELRKSLVSGRDGTSAARLLDVARSYGLRGRGIRVEIEDLHRLPAASILHWEFRHFVIFQRLREDCVDIVDPRSGIRSIPINKFRQAFTGVALVFQPSESFDPGGAAKPQRISGLFTQILAQHGLVIRIISSSLLVQILSAIVPLFTAILIDRVLPHRDYSLLLVLTLGYCVFQIFNLLAGFVRSHLLIYLRIQVESSFTLRFLDHLIDLPYKFFQEHTSGDLMVRLGSNNTVREILTSTTLSALLDGTMAATYLALLMLASVQLTFIVIVLAGARFVVLWSLRRRQRQFVAEMLENQSKSQTYEVEMITGMETLKAMGLEAQAAEVWSNLFVDGLNISIRQGRFEAIFAGLLNLLGTATSLCFLFYGTYLVLRGSLTLGMMMAFSALAGGFLGPLNNLASAALQLQMVEVYLERLNDVMNTRREQDTTIPVSFSGTLRGAVDLEHVSFRYHGDLPFVVENVSIHIDAGTRVAIVGRTGCGKSTLARLIAGLYEPTAGRILFDDKELRHLDLRSVRNQLGIVTQDTQLFGGSIRRNIALSDPQMAFDRIVRAARIAEIHDEIISMPMGYETPLADRGLSLSGGQRQRLALARALARTPGILILDEATSQLDAATEECIGRNLMRLNCTQVIIAHRLSTIRSADIILVLDRGKIVERGSYDQLIQSNGVFAGLVSAQRDH
jgi:ATP-binding cassette subfamily B protein